MSFVWIMALTRSLDSRLTLEEGDELISVRETDGQMKILIATHDGSAVCFDETDVRPTGRGSMERPQVLMVSTAVRRRIPFSVKTIRSSLPSTTLMPTTLPVLSVRP